jgi:dimethylglycine dehydrogenase
MKSHVRVCVIGGGVVGCSVLYHLTKLGWKDVVLCERKELTAGSSWHAAGGFHALNSDPGVSRLQSYTIALYREVEKLSGQDIGLHFSGGINVAATAERWEALRAAAARDPVLGLNSHLVTPAQIRRMCPLIDITDVYGGVYDPHDGHLDPAGATHAFAKAARLSGAEIYRQTRVLALEASARGSWCIRTDKGDFEAEHVINAAGLWAREVGAMAGIQLPLVPMEHHYLLTEDLPELVAASTEMPIVVDLDGEIYLRQERNGVLLGVYEKNATPWAQNGTPWEYGESELLTPQLERISDALEKGFRRFPSLSRTGLRRVVNGPFTFTPDGNPLVGPVRGLRNYWVACGVMAGFSQGGGVGLALAQWMIEGEPDVDVFAMDVARFGDFATRTYTLARAREFYSRRFQIAYPNEFWPAGRPAKTTPIFEMLRVRGSAFGASYGVEYPLFFGANGRAATEQPTLRRSNAFPCVAAECRAARQSVGILDISTFARYEVTGPGAAETLDRLFASQLPGIGRIRLAPMLTQRGRLMGDLTLFRLGPERFLLTGSGYLQQWHMRWFDQHLVGPGVRVSNVSETIGGVSIFGPRSRTLLSRLVDGPVTGDALPFMAVRELDVGLAPAIVARISVTGELGFELHVPVPYLGELYRALIEAGEGLDLHDVGVYALNSLRLEKSYGIWSREYSRDYTPNESGLARFVAYDKRKFIGREAALADRDRGPTRRLVTLAVDARDADATGYEPIWAGKTPVGFTTSGGYGHTAGLSLAMGYIDAAFADAATELHVTIVDERRPCRILAAAAVDPTGSRLRS